MTVASMKERPRQINDKRHPLSGHVPTTSRLKSRESFIHSVTPLETSANNERVKIWKQRPCQHPTTMTVPVTEVLPPGADSGWTEWKTLNRLRTGVGRCKVNLCKWGYQKDGDNTCDCGTVPQTMEHLLCCPLLEQKCTSDDLAGYTENAKKCVQLWLKHI